MRFNLRVPRTSGVRRDCVGVGTEPDGGADVGLARGVESWTSFGSGLEPGPEPEPELKAELEAIVGDLNCGALRLAQVVGGGAGMAALNTGALGGDRFPPSKLMPRPTKPRAEGIRSSNCTIPSRSIGAEPGPLSPGNPVSSEGVEKDE